VNADGTPAYSSRFKHVGKFHPPGLAPAHEDSGWMHIQTDGMAAYSNRYEHTWGFYCGLAAAKDAAGWMHVAASGVPAYEERYAWVGNFQEGLCPVQSCDGFYHVDQSGRRVYADTYSYAGDFRDGIAVVTSSEDGLCRHITSDGKPLHEGAFIDLDVFHKGFARAKDARGWFHITPDGKACYPERYASVEPFYNGLARADTADGRRVRISPNGATVDSFHAVSACQDGLFDELSSDIVGYWKSLAISASVKAGLFESLPGSPMAVAEKIGIKMEMVNRLLRATTELGLTFKHPDGTWMRTTKGDMLVRAHPSSLAYSALEMAGPHITKWQQLDATLKGHSSCSDVFEEASATPERATHLHLMMNSYASRDYARAVSALHLPVSGVIVDAGGGLGALAQKIKASNPKLDVVVLERPEVCELAAKLGMAGDIKWEAGDFARPWPILADVITMSRVLHDWDDLKCLEILTHAKSSLRAGGRVIIVETVLTEDGWHGGLCDLHLLAVSGGKERTISDFVELCGSAGLTLVDMLDASSLHKALHFKPTSR
jgi:hypothetical protein